jgi:hypothetical protein
VTDTLHQTRHQLDPRMAVAYACSMSVLPKAVTVKNLLICAGVYYLSRWVVLPLAFGFGKLTQGIIYTGNFKQAVVAPLVLHLPLALVAAGVGASAIWLVDSTRPLSCVTFPALLYLVFGFLGYHWAHRPLLHDRVFQTVGALFPALTCVLGGILTNRRRTPSRPIPSPD